MLLFWKKVDLQHLEHGCRDHKLFLLVIKDQVRNRVNLADFSVEETASPMVSNEASNPTDSLPTNWEELTDKYGNKYYVDHANNTITRSHPKSRCQFRTSPYLMVFEGRREVCCNYFPN